MYLSASKTQILREYFYWVVFLSFISISLWVLNEAEYFPGDDFSWLYINIWSGTSLIFSIIYFLFLGISALFCQHYPPNDKKITCSVIVPAYNESRHIAETLQTLLDSDFPQEDLEIIAVNDGSQDDTLYWIKQANASGRINIIDLKQNQGKKHALYQAIKIAKNEFIITVDSDTIVKKDTLKKLLFPFTDPRIGAVAGMIQKKADAVNFHTLMCDVMLIFGCGLLRQAQSFSGNVFCTPGALSAYRKSAVMPLLDEWLNQTFLGTPSRIGEDRAIASLLLQKNWQIVYQPAAESETCLPETYTATCKMLLRWTRSDIRENILMLKFIITGISNPDGRFLNIFLHWFFLNINMLLPLLAIPGMIFLFSTSAHIGYKIAMLLVVNMLWSLIPVIVYYLKRKSIRRTIWAFIFGFYAQFALSWITLYSLFTLHNSNWLTRTKN